MEHVIILKSNLIELVNWLIIEALSNINYGIVSMNITLRTELLCSHIDLHNHGSIND